MRAHRSAWRGRSPPRRWPALPTGRSMARSTGSGSSRALAPPRSRCSASPVRLTPSHPIGSRSVAARRRIQMRRVRRRMRRSLCATSPWAARRCLAAVALCCAVAALAARGSANARSRAPPRIWPQAPLAAYSRLDEAAKLNPLSDRAYLVAGSIALRFGDLARARTRLLAGARAGSRRRLCHARARRDRLGIGRHARAPSYCSNEPAPEPARPLTREPCRPFAPASV